MATRIGAGLQGLLGRRRPWSPSDPTVAQERSWLNELMRTYNGPSFQQWYRSDNITDETDEMRRAYRLALAEPTVKAAVIGKVLNVASLDLRVIPANKRNARDNEIADFVKSSLQGCRGGVPKIVWNIAAPGLIDGWSLNEPVWTTGDQGKLRNRWTLADFKMKDTKFVRPITDEFRNVVAFQAMQHNNGMLLDPKDFVHFTYMSFFENPTGMSDLRAANRAIKLKVAAVKLRMMFLDRYSGPYFKGKVGDPTARAELATALGKARSQGYIVLDEQSDVEVIDLASRGTSDFKSAIDDLDKEIVVSVYGAFLHMLEGTNGDARGSSQVQKTTAELFVWYLSTLVCQTIQEQLVPELVVPNFGRDVDYPRIALEAVNPNAILKELEIDEKLKTLGLDLSKEDIYDRASRNPPASNEDRLPGAQPPPTGMGGGFPGFSGPPPPPGPAPTPPTLPFAEDLPASLTALPGKDGRRLEELLAESQRQGVDVLNGIARSLVERSFAGEGVAFTADEREQLADAIASSIATADLLGRLRAHEMAAKAEATGGLRTFSETPFECFAEVSIEPLPPERAIAYFQGLVPDLGGDPRAFGALMKRQAFTMAMATEKSTLERVQKAIAENLKGTPGRGQRTPQRIDEILDKAGMSGRNPQYSEMVIRTNAMEVYNTAHEAEVTEDPALKDFFPVWEYLGVADGRQGDDHAPQFGKFYANTESFKRVRGPRLYNCRCTQRYVDRYEWAELQAVGAKLSSPPVWTFSEPPLSTPSTVKTQAEWRAEWERRLGAA